MLEERVQVLILEAVLRSAGFVVNKSMPHILTLQTYIRNSFSMYNIT